MLKIKQKPVQSYLNLVKTLSEIESPELMEDFLQGLLTEKEFEELSTRLEIIKLLKQGMPQHKIAEKLGVGVATVTRGSKELQKGKFKYLNRDEK